MQSANCTQSITRRLLNDSNDKPFIAFEMDLQIPYYNITGRCSTKKKRVAIREIIKKGKNSGSRSMPGPFPMLVRYHRRLQCRASWAT